VDTRGGYEMLVYVWFSDGEGVCFALPWFACSRLRAIFVCERIESFCN
jgi:hypothetical protein